MGWIRHHGIVVTSWNRELLEKAHAVAKQTLPGVTNIVDGVVNSYGTFLVGPDGSKEGGADSDLGDSRRDAFIKWLDAQAYDDGSNALAWLEYAHDTDGETAEVTRFQRMPAETVTAVQERKP